MSKTAEFYRTPSQDEVEHEERLEYLEWYQNQKQNNNNQNENQNGNKSTLSNK
jgi:hypothetical protein